MTLLLTSRIFLQPYADSVLYFLLMEKLFQIIFLDLVRCVPFLLLIRSDAILLCKYFGKLFPVKPCPSFV